MTQAMDQRVHRNKRKGIFQDLKGEGHLTFPPPCAISNMEETLTGLLPENPCLQGK